MSATPANPLPNWLDAGLLPLLNLLLALLAACALVLAIGQNPWQALMLMAQGAFGNGLNLGYTLYYSTSFIFAGLAVAVALHAGLFNIGGEGQATLGGIGVGLCMLTLDAHLPAWAALPLAVLAGAIFGAAWAFIPGWLQAHRGSHVVITTMMFNFMAQAFLVWLLVNHLQKPGSLVVESRIFEGGAGLPTAQSLAAHLGWLWPNTPLNASFALAIGALIGVWLWVWHTPSGFALRAAGSSPRAAAYAGIRPERVVVLAMCISGGLAGMVGVNEIIGVHHKLLLDFVSGAGYVGIAVALMGRNHPLGIALAALLFGALYQGGSELSFEIPAFTRDMVVTIQGLVVLFSGALAFMLRPWLEGIYIRRTLASPAKPAKRR